MNNSTTTTTMAPVPPPNPMHDALKAVLILTLFFISFLASILPFLIRKWASDGSTRHIRVFSLLSVLGGGVFLSTCLLDLLPDAIKNVRQAQVHGYFNTVLPLSELIVALGFLFVLAVEQFCIGDSLNLSPCSVALFLKEQEWIGDETIDRLISHEEVLADPRDLRAHAHTYGHGKLANCFTKSHKELLQSFAVKVTLDDSTDEIDPHFDPSSHSTMRAALLVMALSLHAVFEGLSLGIMQDVNVILQVFFALLLHKSIIGFSLGLRLVQSKMRVFTVIICCLIFTSQVIIGGFGGIAVLDLISAGSPSKAVMITGCAQAFACGTFLYITCFEILPHELGQPGLRLLKLVFLAVGFSIIAVMLEIFPDQD
uniref:ZIP4_domain domain-containing protein n=1 Tax=Enterobius vermicularis TaxID=51028 RepID=A0A0N4VGU7_ENTVE